MKFSFTGLYDNDVLWMYRQNVTKLYTSRNINVFYKIYILKIFNPISNRLILYEFSLIRWFMGSNSTRGRWNISFPYSILATRQAQRWVPRKYGTDCINTGFPRFLRLPLPIPLCKINREAIILILFLFLYGTKARETADQFILATCLILDIFFLCLNNFTVKFFTPLQFGLSHKLILSTRMESIGDLDYLNFDLRNTFFIRT